jgi:hypothetical protein
MPLHARGDTRRYAALAPNAHAYFQRRERENIFSFLPPRAASVAASRHVLLLPCRCRFTLPFR